MLDDRLLETLAHRVVIGDGAVGTQLVARGVPWGTCLDELNLSQPNLVLAVHYEYRAAGAEAIETNTFGANRWRLERAGLGDQVAAICTAGARLARQAAGAEGFVLGSIGPVGRAVRGGAGPVDDQELASAYREQAAALDEAAVDALLLETFNSMDELLLAVTAARSVSSRPIIAQFALTDRVHGEQANTTLRALLTLLDAGANVLGGNCGFGPLHLVQTVGRLSELTDAPLSAWPNASFPQVMDGRFVFSDQVDYFVDAVAGLAAKGVGLLGGCCGTTPDHIRLLSQRLAGQVLPARTVHHVLPPASTVPRAVATALPTAPRLLDPAGPAEPRIIVELDPPRGMDWGRVLSGATELYQAGADAISIADNPLASLRMSSLALSHLVQLEAPLTAVCHLTCRDHNLLGLQSLLMGASALGVHTILALTGDPLSLGGVADCSAVFDTNSFGLIQMLNDLNAGRNVQGQELDRRTEFEIGVAFDPNAKRLDAAVRRLEKKIAIGCHFAMSQMVYDTARVREMYDATAHLTLPIFVGFMPLVSARNARFLHHEVPGMRIPDAIQERLERVDGDREASQREGLAIAREWIDEALAVGAPGIYLVTPFGRVEMMVSLVHYIKTQIRAGAWAPRA